MKHALLTVFLIMSLALIAHFADQAAPASVPVIPPVADFADPPADEGKNNGFVFKGLESRDSRRSFYGAPPVIPHRIGKTDKECLTCHTEAKTFMGHTSSPTPHPELVNCQQCHVRGNGPAIFKETITITTNWAPMTEPKMGSRNHPFAPPTLPHRLHMRENCAACHNQAHPHEEQRVSHSERVNCTQCHVADYKQAASPFSHEFKE